MRLARPADGQQRPCLRFWTGTASAHPRTDRAGAQRRMAAADDALVLERLLAKTSVVGRAAPPLKSLATKLNVRGG